jgi:hypothetical protein
VPVKCAGGSSDERVPYPLESFRRHGWQESARLAVSGTGRARTSLRVAVPYVSKPDRLGGVEGH